MSWNDFLYLAVTALLPISIVSVAVWVKCRSIQEIDLMRPSKMKGGDPVGRNSSTDTGVH